MTKILLLIASLSLNALFAGWIVWQKKMSDEVAPKATALSSPGPEEKLVEPEATSNTVPEPTPPRWSDVTHHDLAVYASNLSDLGVPEVLANAILLGAVRERISILLANADHSDSKLCPLPLHQDWNRNLGGTLAISALSAFRSECRRLGISIMDLDLLNALQIAESPTAFLPENARGIIEEYEKQIDEVRASETGKTTVDRTVAKLVREREQKLKEVLTPHDFDEYELRTSPYSRLPRTVRGIKLTTAEMRAITLIYLAATRFPETPINAERRLAALLGKERLAAWRKAVGMPGL